MGEVHPRVLEALGVPVPVVWAEVDLTGLWTLVRRDRH
jgi:phenylalanyl-tRNA synthetase beta subunit